MTQLLGPQGVPGSPADFPAQGRGLVWPVAFRPLRPQEPTRLLCSVMSGGQGFHQNPKRPGATSVRAQRAHSPTGSIFVYIDVLSFLTWHSIHFLVVVPVQDFFKSYKI